MQIRKYGYPAFLSRGFHWDHGPGLQKGWGSGRAGEPALLQAFNAVFIALILGHLSVKSVKAAGIQYILKSDPACLKLTIQSKKPLWKNFTLVLYIHSLVKLFYLKV